MMRLLVRSDRIRNDDSFYLSAIHGKEALIHVFVKFSLFFLFIWVFFQN